MAHSLNLCVVAEGIEHPWQYDFLKQHDCDEAQGYLIGRPVPAEEIQVGQKRRRQCRGSPQGARPAPSPSAAGAAATDLG